MAWRAAARFLSVWVPKEIIPSSEEKSWFSPALFPRQLPDERRRRLIDRVSVGCASRLDDWDAITHLYAPCYHLSGPFHQYNKPFKGKFSNTVVLFAPFFARLIPSTWHRHPFICKLTAVLMGLDDFPQHILERCVCSMYGISSFFTPSAEKAMWQKDEKQLQKNWNSQQTAFVHYTNTPFAVKHLPHREERRWPWVLASLFCWWRWWWDLTWQSGGLNVERRDGEGEGWNYDTGMVEIWRRLGWICK